MISLAHYLCLSSVMFTIGMAGIFINRKNLIVILMCLELMLLAVNTNFVAFGRFHQNVSGEVFVLFILTVAAAEAAIGLALLVLLFRHHKTVDVEEMGRGGAV